MHPAPTSSIHLHSAHFSLYPALCNNLNIIRAKISYIIEQISKFSILEVLIQIRTSKSTFGQIWTKKVKVPRYAWKLAYIVSRGYWFLFRHLLSEFSTLNPFLGKFGPKKLKLSLLLENWHSWYLGRADSYSGVKFSKFRPQNPFLSKLEPKKHSLFILIWDLTAAFGHWVSFGFIF